jgi:gas vesicle protein
MDELQAQLIAEQFNRLKDNIEARFHKIERQQSHEVDLNAEKLAQIHNQLDQIQKMLDDHEERIRTVDDAVIAQRSSTTIMQAVQVALTIIASAIAAYLGGK